MAARIRWDETPVDLPAVKKALTADLARVYPAGRCGDFTQALMELGATVCLPGGAPRCEVCPLASLCLAHRMGRETAVPVRLDKKPRRQETMTVLILQSPQGLALRKRPEKGLLAGLWEFPHVPGLLEPAEALAAAEALGAQVTELKQMAERKHIFTHVEWEMRGYYLQCSGGVDLFWVPPARLTEAYALPTAFRQFLDAESD